MHLAVGVGTPTMANATLNTRESAHEVPLVQLLTADAAMRDRGFVPAQGIGYNLQQ